jgi:hypothetical protein
MKEEKQGGIYILCYAIANAVKQCAETLADVNTGF